MLRFARSSSAPLGTGLMRGGPLGTGPMLGPLGTGLMRGGPLGTGPMLRFAQSCSRSSSCSFWILTATSEPSDLTERVNEVG
jgi:hypothetical protein